MAAFEDNLNYALGRLGLVTHEFKQISTGISDALISLKEDSTPKKGDEITEFTFLHNK